MVNLINICGANNFLWYTPLLLVVNFPVVKINNLYVAKTEAMFTLTSSFNVVTVT